MKDDLNDPNKLKAMLARLEEERELRGPNWVRWAEGENGPAYFNAERGCLRVETAEGPIYIETGVPRSPGYGKCVPSPLPKEPPPEPRTPLTETSPPDVATEPRPVWTQVRPASENDPGAIAEGTYTIERGAVHVSDMYGKPLASRTLGPDDDPESVARRLLRENRKGFYDPIPLPNSGIV